MRKWFAAVLLLLLVPCAALAEGLGFTVCPDAIRPGKIERISFMAPSEGSAQLTLLLPAGDSFAVIRESVAVSEGVNHLTWDGEDAGGEDIPAGEYLLCLTLNGESVSRPLTVGEPSPQILSLSAGSELVQGARQRACHPGNQIKVRAGRSVDHGAFPRNTGGGERGQLGWKN